MHIKQGRQRSLAPAVEQRSCLSHTQSCTDIEKKCNGIPKSIKGCATLCLCGVQGRVACGLSQRAHGWPSPCRGRLRRCDGLSRFLAGSWHCPQSHTHTHTTHTLSWQDRKSPSIRTEQNTSQVSVLDLSSLVARYMYYSLSYTS